VIHIAIAVVSVALVFVGGVVATLLFSRANPSKAATVEAVIDAAANKPCRAKPCPGCIPTK
jgi:hypothetical protein